MSSPSSRFQMPPLTPSCGAVELRDAPGRKAADLIDTTGRIRVGVLLAELGIRAAEVAHALGIAPQVVHSWMRASSVKPTTPGAHVLFVGLVRVLFFLRLLAPEEIPRHAWLRRPLLRFRGESPLELLLSGRGDEVLTLLWEVYSGDTSL